MVVITIITIPLVSMLREANTPASQIPSAAGSVIKNNPIYTLATTIASLGIGIFCGYISAFIAKHDEIINGVLASAYVVLFDAFLIVGHHGGFSIGYYVLRIILFLTTAALGGYFRYHQMRCRNEVLVGPKKIRNGCHPERTRGIFYPQPEPSR